MMNTFRRKSVPIIKQTSQLPRSSSVIIKPLDYVLSNIKSIKFAYYQNEKLVLNKRTEDNLVLFFADNSPVQLPLHMIQCFATSSNDPAEHTVCTVEKTAFPGQYIVSFTPLTRGINKLYIRINDVPVYSLHSPISIPPSMRSTPTNTFTRLKYPYAIETFRNSDIMVVTEYFSHRLILLDKNGRFIKSIGSHGNKLGEFNHPTGLAFTAKGTLLVADRDNNRIQEIKFDKTLQGECVSKVGRRGSGCLQFNKPEGIAVCPSTGMVFVADCYNHRIQVLYPDLSFSHTIGRLGIGPGEFKHPFNLAFDSKGYMYVTNRCNDRLQKITPDGQMCTIIRDNLDGPTGIAIDDQDLLYVCEYGIDLIAAFSTEGDFIPCELQGMCKGPYGIKFNPFNGDIIVCDTRNNRLLVF